MKIGKSLEWIASKSFRNCHAEGVDSLLFDDTPGARVRAFICRREHTLWRNRLADNREVPFSVGLHPHHCDITLDLIFGNAFNIVEVFHGGWRTSLREFNYQSAITGEQGRFIETGSVRMVRLVSERLTRGCPFSMRAADLHTIFVPKDEEAAWFVYEGADDPEYKARAYSDDDLTALDFSQLYQPMSVERAREEIVKMGI